MRRIFALILAGLAAVAVFGGLVCTVLAAAQVSEPTTNTIHGATPRRIWATTCAVLGLASVIIGGQALRRSAAPISGKWRKGAIVALVTGLLAAANGALNLAVATGRLGSGNGVVGGAAALVLGLIGMSLGGRAVARFRRIK